MTRLPTCCDVAKIVSQITTLDHFASRRHKLLANIATKGRWHWDEESVWCKDRPFEHIAKHLNPYATINTNSDQNHICHYKLFNIHLLKSVHIQLCNIRYHSHITYYVTKYKYICHFPFTSQVHYQLKFQTTIIMLR